MKVMKDKIIAVVGPTASGKSDLAVLLAKELGGEVISADSAQVYRGLNIGSAKITVEEQQGVPHHLLDIVGPETDYNIGCFQRDARCAIKSIVARGNLPILCGGSGLYINSVINKGYDLEGSSEANHEQRKSLMKWEAIKGEGTIHQMLTEKFPNRAAKIHPKDYQRILRAFEMTKDIDPNQEYSWESPYNLSIYGLTMNRERLYQRIEKRVDRMFEQGLIEEVEKLIQLGYDPHGNALSALGYKEILPLLEGRYHRKEAAEILKRNTRHFAKRQLTWFRRDPRICWFEVVEENSIKEIANKIIHLEKNSKS